ncbi:uncharacterized protein LOC135831271 [Planococcus citri]|uniref:uncharacterized protein LOC135831271 n=1 Tax=Planococcus citri TaxID=170843 RepID=UPI0031F9C835
MDYLQMDIDLKPFETFLRQCMEKDKDFDPQMLELCNFISGNRDYQYLESNVHYYLSCHFVHLLNHQEFLLLQLEDLVDIMKMQQRETLYYPCAYEKNIVSRICAKWICHDVKKRSNGFIKLVNAANYRLFRTSFRITAANVNIPLNNVKEDMIEEGIRRYFFDLLDYNGEIDLDDPENQNFVSSVGCTRINEIYKKQKWIKFFENEYLYDVTIKAGEKTYKLHQSVLKTASRYFTDLFSAKNCQSLGQSAESSTCKSKDIHHTVNIDENTFDAVVRYIYFDDIELKTLAESLGMLKAGETLKMNKLIEKSLSWIENNAKDVSIEEILQILDLTVDDDSFSNVSSSACKQISNLVCKFFKSDAAKNLTRDFYHRVWKVNETLQCDILTIICTRWVVENLRTLNNDDITKILNKKHAENQVLKSLNYYRAEKSSFDCVTYMLYASENWGLEKLVNVGLKWIIENVDEMTPENVIEVLNFTRDKERFDREHAFLLYKHVLATWPYINESLFCTITCATLKNILALPSFHFDDPHQIVDICAKWIAHDVGSRYQLIPEIASSINRNRTVNRDDYKIAEIPQDLSSCSQQSIREKLWEILCVTSLVPHSSTEDSTMGEIPIFIATSYKYDGTAGFRCNILDVKLNSIAPLRSLQFHYEDDSEKYYHPEYPLSATLIEDNLFMLCEIYHKSAFYVYNLSLKKLYSLAGIPRIARGRDGVILNCEGRVYCCFRESGAVMRYSTKLNRWEMIFKGGEIERYGFNRVRRIYLFTSDGTHLYRIFKNDSNHYVAQMWNSQQNSWIFLPDLPTLRDSECPLRLTNVKDGIAILLQSVIFLFDLKLSSWREISLPVRCLSNFSTDTILITYYDNGLLYVFRNEMYQLQNLQGNWAMMKDKLGDQDFYNVAAVHRCFKDTCTSDEVILPEKKKKRRRRKNKNQS